MVAWSSYKDELQKAYCNGDMGKICLGARKLNGLTKTKRNSGWDVLRKTIGRSLVEKASAWGGG